MGENETVTALTPHEVEQLVSLRLGLDDALLQARRASKYRRGAAIVALDAVVERASAIVASTRAVARPKNGNLDDLISCLKESFGVRWTSKVLPDIKHLRRARNAAQHEGLEPDRDQLPVWSSAAEDYVVTLIEAQYSVDIRRVVLADAIRDGDLRALVHKAEQARDAGDYRRSVDHASEAYADASLRWKRLRNSLRSTSALFSTSFRSAGFDHMEGEFNALRAIIDAATFSGNAADAEWFTTAISERGDVVDADDAERVLTFTFGWVTEYERAAETWTPNRRHRADVASRSVRSHDGPARIASCKNTELRHERIHATFNIVDLPDDEQYRQWSRTLREILRAQCGDARWSVKENGTVDVDRPADQTGYFPDDASLLASALVQAETTMRAQEDAATERVRVLRQRKSENDQAIEAIKRELPEWVQSIEWSDEALGEDDEQWVLVTSEEAARLRFGERKSRRVVDDRKYLRDVIREHPLVRQCYTTGQDGALGITPVLSAEELRTMLTAVDLTVCVELEADQRRRDQQQAALTQAKKGIAARLVDLE